MEKVLLATTTATFANKGKDILEKNGINSEIRKLQGGTAVGCLFGIVVSGGDRLRAEKLLEKENIRIISVKEVPS